MIRTIFNRATLIIFGVMFVLNALFSTVIYSFGFTAGYEGETAWSWEQYGATLGSLFGDIPSLLALIGGLAVFIAALALAGWFAHRQNVTGSIVWFIIGGLGGGFILFRLVDWSSFGFGFGPVIALVVFTVIEELLILLLVNRLRRP